MRNRKSIRSPQSLIAEGARAYFDQIRQNFSQKRRRCGALAKRKVDLAIERVELVVDGNSAGLRLVGFVEKAHAILRFFDRREGACGEQSKNSSAPAGRAALRNQDRQSQNQGE